MQARQSVFLLLLLAFAHPCQPTASDGTHGDLSRVLASVEGTCSGERRRSSARQDLGGICKEWTLLMASAPLTPEPAAPASAPAHETLAAPRTLATRAAPLALEAKGAIRRSRERLRRESSSASNDLVSTLNKYCGPRCVFRSSEVDCYVWDTTTSLLPLSNTTCSDAYRQFAESSMESVSIYGRISAGGCSIDLAEAFGANISLTTSLDLSEGMERITVLGIGSAFPNLQTLYSKQAQLEVISSEMFKGLSSLTELDFFSNRISALPRGVFNSLSQLETLDLSSNIITALTKNVFDALVCLTDLSLGTNAIVSLPIGIFDKLQSLTHLSLSFNPILALPESIFDQLTALRFLYLDSTALTSLPTRVFRNLSLLEDLFISSTALTALPTSVFDSLTKLKRLILSSNAITSIPAGMFDELSSLQTLYLSSNPIPMFPAGVFGALSALTQLDLSGTQLEELPPGVFDSLSRLTELDLSSCLSLSMLPDRVFDKLATLTTLDLSSGSLTAVPDGLFAKLTGLTSLRFTSSVSLLTTLPGDLLSTLGALTDLELSFLAVRTLPSGIFNRLSGLTTLTLSSSSLSELPEGIFDQLTALSDLNLSNNALRSLLPSVFARLSSLQVLNLASNQLTALHESVFRALSSLMTLKLSNNMLSALPAGRLFGSLQSLRTLDLSSNHITSLPEGLLDPLAMLQDLSLSNNQLRELRADTLKNLTRIFQLRFTANKISTVSGASFRGLRALWSLYLDSNSIASLPSGIFEDLTNLRAIYLASNAIRALPLGTLDSLTNLIVLDVSRNAIATLEAGVFRRLSALYELHLSSNKFEALPVGVFDGLSVLGWLNMTDSPCPSISDGVLRNLTTLIQLQLSGMGLKKLPSLESFVSLVRLDAAGNALRSLAQLPLSLHYLNVSSNPDLRVPRTLLLQVSLGVLDISRTQFAVGGLSCDWQDADHRMSVVLAQEMAIDEGIDPMPAFSSTLSSCLTRVDLLDIADNRLANISAVSAALSKVTYILSISDSDNQGNKDTSRLQLGTDNPVQCSLARKEQTRMYSLAPHILPVLVWECGCNSGFRKANKGSDLCEPIPEFWQPWRIALLCLGMVAVTLGMSTFGRILVQKHRRVKASLELKELLLSETVSEVQALKRAWEISPSDIQLEARIDGDSPGAFGEVWRGKWEGITVAVKKLQQNVMDLDREALEEFHKEVEFMQRTRHSNIVRFFGAGQWSEGGVPFFVVELVSNGSLKAFLRGAGSDETRAVPWAQKLSFAEDIAKGMCYIHSLGQMHRDLKSGNVLITEQNKAKIADFGTVRLLAKGKMKSRGSGVGGEQHAEGGSGDRSQSALSAAASPHQALELTAGKGTPLYMSPEVIRGREYDQSADVWSYGVLLWEIAAQRSPDLLQQEGKLRGPLLSNLLSLLESGKRLHVPEEWPSWWRARMQQCWLLERVSRPKFEELVRDFAPGAWKEE